MKTKTTYLFLLLLAASCSPSLYVTQAYRTSSVMVDYSKYNMFLTESNSVNFEYEPKGSLNAVVTSGMDEGGANTNPTTSVSKVRRDDVYGTTKAQPPRTESGKRYIRYSAESAISMLVDEAKALGADGIINLKIEYIPSYLSNHKYPNDGYSATGMAVTRK